MPPARSKPAWFTPLRLLLIFCFTNVMVYLDRGVIASNGVNGKSRIDAPPEGTGIQGDFDLTKRQDGFLPTAFLVGLLIASPIFSEACKRVSGFKLIAIGMGTWTVATAGCGIATGYASLIFFRMLVGVGEASFVALAAPFIDDYAPPQQKARWFAAFYLCIPVGFAAGYIVGGVVAAAAGWRAAFLLESAAMVPFVLFAALAQPLHLHGTHDNAADGDSDKGCADGVDGLDADESGAEEPPMQSAGAGRAGAVTAAVVKGSGRRLRHILHEVLTDVVQITRHRVWVTMVVSYTLYTAVLGVFAFWGPQAGSAIFDLAGEAADVQFGAVTVLTGIAGSLAGGILLDRLGSNLRNANLLCGSSVLIGWVVVTATFLASKRFGAFLAFFALGEFFLFMLQAPVAAIGMWSVPPPLRPLAISMTTCCIHLLGDVPSPPLIGWLEDHLEAGVPEAERGQQWRISVSIVSALLVLSGSCFIWGGVISRGAPDYRKEVHDSLHAADDCDGTVADPLLQGGLQPSSAPV